MRPFGINLNPYKHRHPDLAAHHLRTHRGEFSVDFDLKFERYLDYIDKCKREGLYQVSNFVEEYKKDLKSIKRGVRKKITGTLER